jgi:hypothetical protein
MACNFLTIGLDPSCEALQGLGGVNKRIWIGAINDIDTITFGTNGEVTALTLVTGSSLKAFIGKKEKHQGTYELTAGDTVNLFNQSVILALYFNDDLERKAINELVNAEDMFGLVQTNAGGIEVYGIANNSNFDFRSFGLEATAGTGNGTGVLINDDRVYRVTMSGNVPNLPMLFKPAVTIENNIIALDAVTYPNTAP